MNTRQKLICTMITGAVFSALAACGGSDDSSPAPANPAAATPTPNPYGTTPTPTPAPSVPVAGSAFKETVVVSDGSVPAPNTDANLRNGWGVAFNPNGFVWVANEGSNTSTLYDGNGVVQSLVVTIPAGSNGAAGPTGIVFNGSTDFAVSAGGGTGAAPFIFASEAGTISGWSPSVLATAAVTAYDDGAGGAVYKGLALASANGQQFIYATDFKNNKVDVFDKNFAKVTLPGGQFKDPALPTGYAPFGIQAVDNKIYVTFAVQAASGKVQTNGAGNGAVDVFDTSGNLFKEIAVSTNLNSPWGIALAPTDFGAFSNDLLIGNFGDGTINAYNPDTGAFIGQLKHADGSVLTLPGIWGMAFGNGKSAQPANTLFYASGPKGKTTGAYGRIDLAN